MDIGMIGLGRMGANMAARLLRGRHRVVVFDTRTRERIGRPLRLNRAIQRLSFSPDARLLAAGAWYNPAVRSAYLGVT